MELWDMSYHKLITGVEDIKEDVIRPVEDSVRKVTEFSQALKDFQESLNLSLIYTRSKPGKITKHLKRN